MNWLHELQVLHYWFPGGALLFLWAFMQYRGKLPSTQAIQEFAAVLNSRGGNILILVIMSIYFFRWSMYSFVSLLHMIADKQIAIDNAVGMMMIQTTSSTAFGGTMGALLKTMTGESGKSRSSDFDKNSTPVNQTVVPVNQNPAQNLIP